MESYWQKINPILYHKIVQYDRCKNQSPYLIVQYQQQRKHLFKNIQEKYHQSNFVFPRKIHQSHKICQKEDHKLMQQLSQKTYNLHQQNPNISHLKQTRLKHYSYRSLNRTLSNNSFVVRKTHAIKSSKDQQKGNLQPSQTSSFTNSPLIHRFLKEVHKMSPSKMFDLKNDKNINDGNQNIQKQYCRKKLQIKLQQQKQKRLKDNKLLCKSLHIQTKQNIKKQKSKFFKQNYIEKRLKTDDQKYFLPII